MTKIKPGDTVRVLDPDRPGAKFSRDNYPSYWENSMNYLIGNVFEVEECHSDHCVIDGWGIYKSDLELIEPKQTNDMKKILATFRFERNYIHECGLPAKYPVVVNLSIDYEHKTFAVMNNNGNTKFLFNHLNNFAQRLAIVGCIKDAIEFAEKELNQTELS